MTGPSPAHRTRTPSWLRGSILALGIAAAGLFAYGAATRTAFQFDDFPAVVENPHLTAPLRGSILFEPSAAGADYVRPVLFMSYRLSEWQARTMAGSTPGQDPDLALRSAVHHAHNLIFHLANALLVLALGRALARRSGVESAAPVCAALLIAVHPALSQGVYYTAARSSVLVTTFGLAAVTLALQGSKISLLFTGLALLTKEPAVVLPVLILVTGRLTDPRRRWPLAAALPHALLAALAVVLWSQRAAAYHQPPVIDFALVEVRAVARYAALLLVPHGLRVDYGWVPPSAAVYWPWSAHFEPEALAGLASAALLLAGLAAIAIAAGRKRPLVAAGAAWFGIALLPTSSFFPIRDPIFEHHLIFAAPGFLLAAADLGVAAQAAARRRWPEARGRVVFLSRLLLVSLVLVFALQARNRARAWQSERALWDDCLWKAPGNPRAAYNLAAALTAEAALSDDPAQTAQASQTAEALYRRALAHHPDHAYAFELRAYAMTNLGYLYLEEAQRAAKPHTHPRDLTPEDRRRLHDALNRAVAVLDTAVTHRVRTGAAEAPFPEAWANLGLARLKRAQLLHALGDPTFATDAARARLALETAWRLRPNPMLRQWIAELGELDFASNPGPPTP